MPTERLKVTVEVDRRGYEYMQRIPFGFKKPVIGAILNFLGEAVDRHGTAAYGMILANKFKLVPTYETEEDKASVKAGRSGN